MWDLATGKRRRTILKGSIRLWAVATGKELVRLQGHEEWWVNALAFSPDGPVLASGARESDALLWDLAPVWRQLPVPEGKELGAEERDRLWAALAGEDAAAAYRAMALLAGAPGEVLPLLQEQLRPAEALDQQRVARLIRDLDHDEFKAREQAAAALKELGDQAEPALRQALASRPPLEARRRLEELLERLERATVPPGQLWELRAVAVRERIGTPEARQLLDELAKGAPEAWLTQEAKAALERLKKGQKDQR